MEPAGRLPLTLDHLIQMPHDTRRAARRITGDLQPGQGLLLALPGPQGHWRRSCRHNLRQKSMSGDGAAGYMFVDAADTRKS